MPFLGRYRSKLEKSIEKQFKNDLETILTTLYSQLGTVDAVASMLQKPLGTVFYWFSKYNIPRKPWPRPSINSSQETTLE
uniref:Uncharacterized protein n=1 Tax=viral metagenome TaxID=1070528 RepID=A0A6M3L9S2_9ZZZZ